MSSGESAPSTQKTQDQDVEQLLTYLEHKDCSLLDQVQEIKEIEMKRLLRDMGNLELTIKLCEEANTKKLKFNSVAEMTRYLIIQKKDKQKTLNN